MPVDFNNTTEILVVHGVQTGANADMDQDKKIRDLIDERSAGLNLDFSVDLFRYEDLNDEALMKYKALANLFLDSLIARRIIDAGIEIVGDVLINLSGGSTARLILDLLKKRILAIYEKGNPLYIVAHSLGTVYSFDAINELITEGHFDRGSTASWPVQSLVTMGSPLGLPLFHRNSVNHLTGNAENLFLWNNYWDRTDPVVTGNVFGLPSDETTIAERFSLNQEVSGWIPYDHPLDNRKSWLLAHTEYWNNPSLGDDLIDMIG